MKYKIGDKVRIKDYLTKEDTGIFEKTFDNMKSNIYTVCNEGNVGKDGLQRNIQFVEDDNNFWFREDWLELVSNETIKFRAFLREVICGSLLVDGSPYNAVNTDEFDIGMDMNDAMKDICRPVRKNLNHEEVEKVIDRVVKFYTEFEPTIVNPVKKMTKAEIEAELGYEIEIVEE